MLLSLCWCAGINPIVHLTCSSDVYSALWTKAKVIFMTVCYSHEPLIIILVHASNSATWPLLYVVMCMYKRCVYQILSLSSPSSAPGNETILWAGWTLATKGRVWVLACCFYRDFCVSLCHRYRIAMVVSNQIKCNLRPRLVVFKVKVPHFFTEDELTTEVCDWGIFYCVSIPTRDRHSMSDLQSDPF